MKIFPCANKIPLIKDWQKLATQERETIDLWQDLYRGQLTQWGVPTGPSTDLLVLDIDVKADRNGFNFLQVNNLQLPQTLSQQTASGGTHVFFKYPKDGKHYGNKANLFGSKEKPSGLDIRGVGGYVIWYGADFGQPIVDAPPWLLEAVSTTAIAHEGTAIRIDPSIASASVQSSLDAIRDAPEGESNNVLNVEAFKVGQLVASGSITHEYAEQALLRAAKDRGKPEREALATIASGLKGGLIKPRVSPFGEAAPVAMIAMPQPPAPPSRWTPRKSTLEELLDRSKLRKPQLFKDWSTEDIQLTTADGGTGKTTLKIYEAFCLALGQPFLGFECVQPGKTLYITGEDTDGKIRAMIGDCIRQAGWLDQPSPENNEKIQIVLDSIYVKKEPNMCLISKSKDGMLHPNSEALRSLMEAVDDIQPKMIVFDPISSFWGSESSVNDMARAVTKLMGELAERGICVEMLNHMGKVSSGQKDISQFAGRGGTGLPSNSRVVRVMHKMTEEEYQENTGMQIVGKQEPILCVISKFTDGSPLYNKQFAIVRDDAFFYRVMFTPQKQKEAESAVTDAERVFTFVREQRNKNKYPTRSVLIGHFMTISDSISEARVKRAIDWLCFQGHMGAMLKIIENPDQLVKDKVYIVTDGDGKEI